MQPIATSHPSEFVYGAPLGMEDRVGGLPCTREQTDLGGTAIFSIWEPTAEEREAIAAGANLRLGIFGPEPISPVSLGVTTLATLAEPDAEGDTEPEPAGA